MRAAIGVLIEVAEHERIQPPAFSRSSLFAFVTAGLLADRPLAGFAFASLATTAAERFEIPAHGWLDVGKGGRSNAICG